MKSINASKIGGMGIVGVIGLLVVGACASSNQPARSPEDQSAVDEQSMLDQAATTPAEEPDAIAAQDESSQDDAGSASDSEPASQQDLEQALQVVIQDEALLGELKLGEPGRFPLKIAGSSVDSSMKLEAHTKAVEVVSNPPDTKTVPILVFTNIDMNAKQGVFKYRYEIEGVRGTTYVSKNSAGVWELKSSRVSEY